MSQPAWNVLTAVTAVLLAALGAYLHRLYKRLREIDKTLLPLQLRFQYTRAEAEACRAAAEPGRALLVRFGWWFLPMLALCALAMAVVAHNAAGIQWMRWAMYAFAAAGCALGAAETLCLQLGGHAAAPALGRAKWVCFGVWTAGMFAGLFIQSWAL